MKLCSLKNKLISFVSLVYKRKVATVQIENGGLSFLVVSIFLVKNHNELMKHCLKKVLVCVNNGLLLCLLA